MRYKSTGLFRKRCRGYHVFQLSECSGDRLDLRSTCMIGRNLTLQLPVVELDVALQPSSEIRHFAIPFPLVDGSKRICLEIHEESASSPLAIETFSGNALKWRSRIDYRTHRTVARMVEELDRSPRLVDAPIMHPLGVFPYDNESVIIRVEALISHADDHIDWETSAVIDGDQRDDDLIILRDTTWREHRILMHSIALSLKVPRSARNVVIAASPTLPGTAGCALGYIPTERDIQLADFVKLTEDAAIDPVYPRWFDLHRTSREELEQQRQEEFDHAPLFSIVIPLFEPPLHYIREAIASVIAQSYANWELILVDTATAGPEERRYLETLGNKRIRIVEAGGNLGIAGNTNLGIQHAKGDYIAFLDQDDVIEPDALYRYAEAIRQHPKADLLYCDEDSFTELGDAPFHPLLKPDFNLDLLYSHNYVIHLLMVSRYALGKCGLSPDESSGAQDYDLTLRVSEIARSIVHIPRVLYHWRQHANSSNEGNIDAKPYAVEAGKRALAQHFERRGLDVKVKTTDIAYLYTPEFHLPGDPMVSIVIPNKDHIDYLEPCIHSIVQNAGGTRYEIVVVENNSTDPNTFAWYEDAQSRLSDLRVISFSGPFNYSKIVNLGAKHAQGDYLLFLNNDTTVQTENFLAKMLGYFSREEVGVVGPLLLYPDGLVQQAGIALMKSERLGFMNQNHSLSMHQGYLGGLGSGFDYSAVMGACQMVSSSLFNQVGGYCEDLAVTYNDIDFCWRVSELQYLIVYTPSVTVIHREFGSRGSDTANAERAAQTQREAGLMRMRWPKYFAQGDPCLNSNCDNDSPYFKLSRM